MTPEHSILLVEDSPEDREATMRALARAGMANPIHWCGDGDDALDYLFQRGKYANGTPAPRPSLVLLDLNLPGTDGREVLAEIKGSNHLKTIPVLVLTTSTDSRDIDVCYRIGANSYIKKPVDLDGFMQSIQRLKDYWFEVVVLPRPGVFAMSQQPYRILIIDDCDEDRAAYRRHLTSHHDQTFEFFEAKLGEQGGELAREIQPHCILLDFRLPDLDGLEVLARIRAECTTARVPVIMLTGHGSESVAVQAMRSGVDDYLIKSIDNVRLSQTVQLVIDKGILREQLVAQGEELERLTAERLALIDELKAEKASLAEANRRKDEFLATLAHELRNPLAPLRNSLDILRYTDANGSALAEIRATMERQVNHMVRLVDDLLEVSRITRGKIELRKDRIELATILRNAIETSRPLIEAGGHQLAMSLPAESVVVDADPMRLAQVFANLLNNAAKYTEHGGQIWLTATCESNEVVVSVRDTGLGLQADMLPKVFDLFTQIDRTLGRAQGGLGIGLALVKRLVEMHGGIVTAYSAGPGQGADFTVHLPLSNGLRCNSSGGSNDAVSSSAALTPHRILVVDDNQDAAKTLGVLLRLLGAEVQVLHDGPSAIEAVGVFHPAIVLLDIGMPGMDGYEVARRLRQLPQSRDSLLVAVTGWGQADDRRRTREAGFDHHLVKPVQFDAIRGLLAALEANSGSLSQ